MKGIRGNYTVCNEEGQRILCRAGASLFQKNSIAVGDFVFFQQTGEKGWISETLPRKNQIIRSKYGKGQVLFVNLDQIFLLDALNHPQSNFVFTAAYAFSLEKIKPIILLTKEDLCEQKTKQELLALYQSAGLTVFTHNLFDKGANQEFFLQKLKNKTSLFFGQSGVGKSSLLNYLFNDMDLKTRKVQKNMLGQHTTTTTEIYKKKGNIFIADSPGIREFVFVELNKKELARKFFLMEGLSENCFFNDCLHHTEPKCAIKKALADKNYHQELYKYYLQLLNKK